MLAPFVNEAFTNFSLPDKQKEALDALEQVRAQLGRTYPLWIGGENKESGDWIDSYSPNDISMLVGRVAKGNIEWAEQAMQAAERAFPSWSRTPARERARYLLKAAAIMRRRKMELAAWIVIEIGKTWAEADADVAEAIDFLEYYAREMMRIDEPAELVVHPGEENELIYIPLGVGVIIPPWNFPLAILTGMTVSAIVTGNPVVLKPASSTPVIAAKFIEICAEIDLPPGVVNFLPGSGEELGNYLVDHPRTRFISFTGSREVGQYIYERAAKVQRGQIWLKRVVAEMGGKDAVVVDETADLDDAARGIVQGAFGFQGQKCSAASRVVAVASIYDTLLQKVTDLTAAIKVGPSWEFATDMGPVADETAYEKIKKYIEIGHKEGRLVHGGKLLGGRGYYIEPTIFADVAPQALIAQDEIFGPVLSFIRAQDFDEALRIANGTVYGLTGSVYSRSRRNLERARHEFHVGNLYFNRKPTGALVGVHPFGGFNMSGTNSKAGGKDYLKLFLQAKSIAEKL